MGCSWLGLRPGRRPPRRRQLLVFGLQFGDQVGVHLLEGLDLVQEDFDLFQRTLRPRLGGGSGGGGDNDRTVSVESLFQQLDGLLDVGQLVQVLDAAEQLRALPDLDVRFAICSTRELGSDLI